MASIGLKSGLMDWPRPILSSVVDLCGDVLLSLVDSLFCTSGKFSIGKQAICDVILIRCFDFVCSPPFMLCHFTSPVVQIGGAIVNRVFFSYTDEQGREGGIPLTELFYFTRLVMPFVVYRGELPSYFSTE